MTDYNEHPTEPTNDINDLNENVLTIRKKRETIPSTSQTPSDVASDRSDSSDDRDKRQIRYGRYQGALTPPVVQSQSWNDGKKYAGLEYTSFRPPYQSSSKVPFKPSAQIDESFSPFTAPSINPYSQYNNQGNFKPYIPEQKKVYSTPAPSRSSTTPNYSFYNVKNQSPKLSSYSLSPTTPVPLYNENFQYFSMKPNPTSGPSITKAPPISSLTSNTEGPFATLSGGFYNNKPRTNSHYVKSSGKQNNENRDPIIQSSHQYHFEIGNKNQQDAENAKKPVRYGSINNSPSVKPTSVTSTVSTRNRNNINKSNVKPQESRFSENYDVRNNVRGSPNNQRKNPNQTHDSTSEKPKNQQEDAEDYDEDESDDEEEEETDGKEENKKSEQSPEIKPVFPDPPDYFRNIENKYENIVNPFADPEFDFDSFISKLRTDHLSTVSPKTEKPDNGNHNTLNNHRATGRGHSNAKNPVNQKLLLQHHNYPGMSTPRPFSVPPNTVSWPAKSSNYSYAPESTKPIYEDDEYYDDDYEVPLTHNNQIQRPNPIQNQVKPPKPSTVKPSLATYNNYQSFKNDHRNPIVNVAQYHQPIHNRLPSPQNDVYKSKPISTSVQTFTNLRDNIKLPQPVKVQNSNSISNLNHKPSTPPRYSPPTNQQNLNRLPAKTEKPPSKRRPIPKPSPEMNDYYYDDDDEDYDYEPPVKSKFMPSTEIKPQRPPIAQNYEEYEDYETDTYKNPKNSLNNKKPVHENDTIDDDEDDEEEEEEEDDEEEENEENEPLPNKTPSRKPIVNNDYSSQFVNHHSITPSKDNKVITPATYETYIKNTQNTKPNIQNSQQLKVNPSSTTRPELANYEVLHRPNSHRLPSSHHQSKYTNQTTSRPYTVRHRLAKPSTTQQTTSSTNPTTETFTRHPTRHRSQNAPSTPSGNDGRTFRQPTKATTTTVKTDNDNQETRDTQTEHDDNAPNRYIKYF